MSFPLKTFWRLIPYAIYATFFYTENLLFVLLLAIALSTSLFKSETFNRRPITMLSYFLFALEMALLMTIGLQNPKWLAAYMIVPIVDWGWQTISPSKISITVLGLLSILIMTMSGHLAISAFILGAAYWIGSSLREMEQKKIKAQEYYDRLRISEEALRKANDELEAYYATLEAVTVLRERTRISREIHDSVGHALSTTLIQLHAIHYRLEEEAPSQMVYIEKLTHFISNALENTRDVVHNMGNEAQRKHHLKHELAELCHNFSELTKVMVTLTFPENELLFDPDHKQVLFRVVQESLTNAVKHGNATKIKVVIAITNGRILLTIHDNGSSTAFVTEGFGLTTMRERIQKLGGEINFISEENNGFMVKASLPGGSQ